jgi:type IV secretion system protein TrbL
MTTKKRIVLFTAILSLFFGSSMALAQDGTILSTVQNQIQAAAQGWQTTIADAARSLFWILAGIEFGIAAVWLAVQAASLETWVSELIRRVMFVGFFAFVLTNGPSFAQAIVDSLFQIGAGGGSASPANIFNAGITVAGIMSNNVQFGLLADNGLAIASVIAMVVVVICFSLVAAIFVAVMAEMYIGILAGIIMLGLGGSSHTKDFAIRYLVYAFSVGMKLMALVMIAKIGSDTLIGLAQNVSPDDEFIAALTIAGISVVIFMIAIYVPQIIQGVVQGVSVSNGMEVIRHGTQTSTFAAGTAIGSAQMAAGAKAAYETARNDGSSRGQAAAQAAMAPFAALSSAAADKLSGAPHAGNASALGLANHKLRQTLPNKPTGGSSPKSS